MTSDDAFLRAIAEEPDDDTHHLVYADWLDDHGRPERAEFIRLQCLLARTQPDDPGRAARESRERELLAVSGADWLGPLHHPLLHWTFRRGFVAGLAHAGVFCRSESVVDDEGYEMWSYLRFYADGAVLFVTSDGSPLQVARWFRRGWQPNGVREPPSGRYTLRVTPEGAGLSFGVTAGYGTGFGILGFDGTVEVSQAGSDAARSVSLVLGVYNHTEGRSERQTFMLVDVPGYDSAAER